MENIGCTEREESVTSNNMPGPGTGDERGTRTKVQVPQFDSEEFELYLADINV